LMARVRIILKDGTEKIYRNAKIHQEKDGSLKVVREIEIIALENVVEPDSDFPCDFSLPYTFFLLNVDMELNKNR